MLSNSKISNLFKYVSNVSKTNRFCGTVGEVQNKKQFPKKPMTFGQPTYETHPHIVNHGELAPGIGGGEFKQRRLKLMETLFNYGRKFDNNSLEHIVIIPSAVKQYMSDKIPYVFRQNTDFYYLSGCLEPESCLVMYVKGDSVRKSTIFMRKKDSQSELWDGPRTGVENALEFFGVDEALPNDDLESFLASYIKSNNSMIWYDYLHPVQPDVDNKMKHLLRKVINRRWESPIPFVHSLRVIKSPAEIALMQKSCKIASEAFIETIKHSRPGCTEHELFARVDYECRIRGAEYLAYPPVVAGGNRANIIHYINNNQIIRNGEMVLMDAGCEYHGYCSDITRTWPINGKFSDEQRILYEIILEIQNKLIKLCSELPTIDFLFDSMCTMLGERLSEINIIPRRLSSDEKTRMAYKFCPHHVSHYLGMDVHDTTSVSRKINLLPGMIITVEPGIYIPEHYNVPTQFQGIGIRIEDDILITNGGPHVLSEYCPKEVDLLERVARKC